MAESKKLGHDDSSGFEFVKSMLGDNVTAAINFDRLQKHPTEGYIIFELLKCEDSQSVTPYTSHPNKYWNKNSRKFLSLWRAKQDLNAKLYLVNYAEAETAHADKVLLIEVLDIDENGIISEKKTKHTRKSFSSWFIDLNNQCLEPQKSLVADIYKNKSADELGKLKLIRGKYSGKTISEIYMTDLSYLDWYSEQDLSYSEAIRQYLKKIK